MLRGKGKQNERNFNEQKCLTFPRASKPLSKNRIMARKVKTRPNPMRPRPTSAIFVECRRMQRYISIFIWNKIGIKRKAYYSTIIWNLTDA